MKNYTALANLFVINPRNIKLNPICHLLALLGVHHILHVSRIRVHSMVANLSVINSMDKYQFVVCFLLGNSLASEFCTPMFWNTLSVPSSYAGRYEEFFIRTCL